jgi:hypothetical protein
MPETIAHVQTIVKHPDKHESNKMIGRELNMREGTVKVHVRSLLKKLNATNRTQLALRAYRAFETAQAVSGGGLTIPAGPAADQGSIDEPTCHPL